MAATDVSLPASIAPEVERRCMAVVAWGTLLLCALIGFMPMRMEAYAHDALIQLEGAWRIHQGLRIHEGVHTPMGALYPYLLALGIHLAGPVPQAFLVPAILPAPFVVWLSWLIFRRRFGPKTTVLLCLFMVSILVGPTCLGDPENFGANWLRTTFGMQYNRTVWPFATLLATLCLIPPRVSMDVRGQAKEAVIAGLLLGLCFFGKVNYFVAGLVVAIFPLFRVKSRSLSIACGLGAFGAVVLIFVALNVPMAAYLDDLVQLGRAQSMLERIQQIGVLLAVNLEYVMTILVLRIVFRDRGRAWLPNAAILLVFFGIIVASANYQERMIPTMIIALFAMAEHVRRTPEISRDLRRVTGNVAAVFCAGWIGVAVIAFGPPYALFLQIRTGEWPGITGRAHSAFYRASIVPKGSAAEAVVKSTDQQARACDRLFGKDAVVYHMGWYNVMPVLRQAPSPRGLLWYHGGRTVTKDTLPPPERELAGVDGIVWPQVVEGEDTLIVEAYRQYVTQFFVPLDADDTASYWRRR